MNEAQGMPVEKIVVYYWQSEPGQDAFGATVDTLDKQRAAVTEYAGGSRQVINEFVEQFDKKRKRFPVLEQAISQAKLSGAIMVIPQLQNLARHEGFAGTLIRSRVNFYCIDQPLVNSLTLPALIENFRQMRKLHSERIRRGLEQTASKLGNPNALKEITKVNKPKTENAVMFAMILAPIVSYYRLQGYSQRRMVEALNEDGFLAPEGGYWVLSQLQKVLERIDLNTVALDAMKTIKEYQAKGFSDEQLIRALNGMNVRAPGRGNWDEDNLAKVRDRLEIVREVMKFNNFVLDVFPKILGYEQEGMDEQAIVDRLNDAAIELPERFVWELEHDNPEAMSERERQWQTTDLAPLKELAWRRREDIEHFIKPNTLNKAMDLLQKQGADPEAAVWE